MERRASRPSSLPNIPADTPVLHLNVERLSALRSDLLRCVFGQSNREQSFVRRLGS